METYVVTPEVVVTPAAVEPADPLPEVVYVELADYCNLKGIIPLTHVSIFSDCFASSSRHQNVVP
jgi:hypothetical protein